MNSKIIAVWGGSNSGKSTFATNLACALSARDRLVGLISTNLVFGELQIFFGQNVPPEKGLFRALSEDNPNIGEKFVESGESKNLFFLSAPTRYTGLLCDTVTLEQVEQMINAASVAFDILVIDGAAELTNPVSGVGLWLAETVCTLHRPSIAAQMWHQSVSDFVRELHIAEKQIHILLAPDGEFDDQTYREMTGLSFPFELTYVKRASELQNAGTPLYFHRDRACRYYGKVLEQIADRICGGGKP
ncbi:cobalamin biosynthesis protein CobQ [Pelotomaculum terephthalicicum JT]|uniref:AAA family ATPase n=1 Tax=Pelotomaculum terephthalicicum TaxID=206393 RepID=UPI001F0396C4|nr:cobalamin biosynthesis protein CobQ [Pelotomaculum terephthalicicum]MCG9968413.1 cobalamin biosynthesis protein CobQ [Pelotomaculum terephthalicicum JT]